MASLSVGDVLGIYDYAVFVTKVNTTSSPLSGEGLVRLPFMNGAMLLVEFSGVSAKAGEEGSSGGCVYGVSDYFRTKAASVAQLQATQQGLISSLLNSAGSSGSTSNGIFVGTLNQALTHYDSLVNNLQGATAAGLTGDSRAELGQYLGAIQQGTSTLLTSLTHTADGGQDSRVRAIQDTLTLLLAQEQTLFSSLMTSSGTTTLTAADLPLLSSRYQALFAQLLQQLTNPASSSTPPTIPTISPVVLSGLTDKTATLRWQGDASFTKYVVHYQLAGAGELLQTVSSPTIQLMNLKPGNEYTYTIDAYQGTQVVSSSARMAFSTFSVTMPGPQNLTYTVLADQQVKVSWDKSKGDNSYQLIYQGADGQPRVVYPTTNQAILTGLDPAQTYTYQVVAFNASNQPSSPTQDVISFTPFCSQFKINPPYLVRDKFGYPGVEYLVFTTSGCENGSIQWSGLGNTGAVITDQAIPADYKAGDAVLGVNILLAGNLDKTATIKATCTKNQLGVKLISCSDQLAVTISDACWRFYIETDLDRVYQGQPATLTASGCADGQVIWSTGETGRQIVVTPNQTTQYWATCSSPAAGNCFRSVRTVNVDVLDCSQFVITSSKSVAFKGDVIALSVPACRGMLRWSTGDTQASIQVTPQQTTTYSVTCIGGNVSCSTSLPITYAPCRFRTQTLASTIRPGDFAILTASDCSGLVDWGNGLGTGSQLVVSPTLTTIYTARCLTDQETCYADPLTITVEANASTNHDQLAGGCGDFELRADKLTITQAQPVVLTTTGCRSDVEWNAGLGTGSNKLVNPTATTTYMATCRESNCQQLVIVNVVSDACKAFAVELPQPKAPDNPQRDGWLEPTVNGCSGAIEWYNISEYNQNGTQFGSALFVPPSVSTLTYAPAYYRVTCKPTGCQNSVVINRNFNILTANNSGNYQSGFQVAAQPGSIKSGESAVLLSHFCNGTVTWNNVPSEQVNQASGLRVFSNQTTTYTATCTHPRNGNIYTVANQAYATVYVNQPACSLVVTATPNLVNDSGTAAVTLLATGCSGTVTWDQGAGTGSRATVYPQQTATYTARCSNGCSGSVVVAVTPCTNFTVTQLTDNRLLATGCQGTVVWQGTQTTGLYLTPVTDTPATYVATCVSTGCQASVFYAKPPPIILCQSFVARVTPSTVYKNERKDITFSTAGCEAGKVEWSNGKTEYSFTESLKLPANLTYTVNCLIGGQDVATAKATVTVIPSGGGDSECKDFYAYAQPLDKSISPYAQQYAAGTHFKLLADNCPYRVEWNVNPADVAPTISTIYTARCVKPDGSICNASNSGSVTINVYDCGIFQNETDDFTNEPYYTFSTIVGGAGNDQITAGCPGAVNWYSNKEHTDLICRLTGTQTKTIQLDWKNQSVYKFYHGCECGGQVYYGSDEKKYFNSSGGRVSATASNQTGTAQSILTGCLPASLPKLMGEYFQKLVCDYLPNLLGSDGKTIDPGKVATFYSALQQAVQGNPTLSSYQPNFSSISVDALIRTFQSADACTQAGSLLASAFAGSVSVDEYNNKIRPTYPDVLNALLNPPPTLVATAIDASCGDASGSITLKATGGTAPYRFSIDGVNFQSGVVFDQLSAGTYTLTVQDAAGQKATTQATVWQPDTELIETPSTSAGTIILSLPPQTTPSAIARQRDNPPYITVRWGGDNKLTRFKLQPQIEFRITDDGLLNIIAAPNPAWVGIYRPYFRACDHDVFVGFYKEGYTGPPCPNTRLKDAAGKEFCPEGFLSDSLKQEQIRDIVIFSNGYRGPGEEGSESADLVETADIRSYWAGQDETFKKRRRVDADYYVDGHCSIITSDHNVANDKVRSEANFARALKQATRATQPVIPDPLNPSLFIPNPCYHQAHCVDLDDTPNVVGFNYRVAKGKRTGLALVAALQKLVAKGPATTTFNIDIVAHSMGFAYAQGVIQSLKASGLSITWDGYYIIAPENGCSGSVNVEEWQQVWQYGSDLDRADQQNADPLWEQDGVAPQCAVKGLTDARRAYIPARYANGQLVPKNYLDCHYITNYGWIFEIVAQLPGNLSNGYVTPR